MKAVRYQGWGLVLALRIKLQALVSIAQWVQFLVCMYLGCRFAPVSLKINGENTLWQGF